MMPRRADPPAAQASRPSCESAVLLIDDDRPVTLALCRMLRGRYTVVIAHGGQDAIERLRRGESYRAVLCDVMMPNVDGLDVFRWICANRPELRRCFAFVTGGVFAEQARAQIAALDVELLYKPVPKPKLLSLIDKLALAS